MREASIPAEAKPALGTIWPKPDTYHVPVTIETMQALAAYLETHPAGYVCSHCHVYRAGQVLLEWYDAFDGDPMYLARDVDEAAVRRLASAIGSTVSIHER